MKQPNFFMGLKNKVLLSVVILIAVTVFLFTYVALGIFQKSMDDKNESFYRQNIKNVSTHMNDYLDEIGAIANESNYNYDLQNYLRAISLEQNSSNYSELSSQANMRDYELAMQIFSSPLNDRTDITNIMVFGKKRMLLYRSIYSYIQVITDDTKSEWYQNAVEAEGKLVVTGPQRHAFLSSDAQEELTVSRSIYDSESGDFLGVILVDINTNEIEGYLNEISTENGGRICILNSNKELICDQTATKENNVDMSDEVVLEKISESIESDSQGRSIIQIDGEKYQIVFNTMERSGWIILALTPYNIYQSATFVNMIEILLLFFLLMVIIMIALNHLLGRIVMPVKSLMNMVDMADAGNLSLRAEVESRDEIGQLANSFNNMLDRIENLKEQVEDEQEGKRRMELQALQAQINPHFLYNTLDAIIWMAETDNRDIVPMTEALAKFFRISLNKGKEFIQMQGELNHVENYLVIQSMRYLDKFTYQIEVADDIKELLTIKLIIQPIVENCIYHGIKQKRGHGQIWIRAYRIENYIKVEIKDDGVGMNQETCENLLYSNEAFANSSGSGIGIKNVNERIQLSFGKSYGLHYESTLGVGTVVTVTLPVIEKSEIVKERWQ
ncbi:MAG: sensor histidine kinase [Lachnotalea sp.]